MGEDSLIVNHYHFGNWKYSEPPQVDDDESGVDELKMILDRSAKFIIDQNEKNKAGTPFRKLLVTCVDGNERTMTTLALIHATLIMEAQPEAKDKRVSVFSIVRRLMQQRPKGLR